MKNTQEKRKEISYQNMFWLFIIGSVLGFIIEGCWRIIKVGHWENHSATVWGPFCIVYGIGAMVLYVLAYYSNGKNIIFQFVICAIVGSVIEYFASLLQERIFGSTSWDYSDQFLNIGGRICLWMSVLWGIFGILFVRLAYPLLSNMFRNMRGTFWEISCICFSVLMLINLLVTSAAVLRWRERLSDIPPSNQVEKLLDEEFDNETMSEIFSNMIFTE